MRYRRGRGHWGSGVEQDRDREGPEDGRPGTPSPGRRGRTFGYEGSGIRAMPSPCPEPFVGLSYDPIPLITLHSASDSSLVYQVRDERHSVSVAQR